MDDFWMVITAAVLFYIVFKVGQISARVQDHQQKRTISAELEQVRITGQRPVITVEEINGVYYAFDGNDFLAQGTTPDELGKLIANRFPNKYHLAKITLKA